MQTLSEYIKSQPDRSMAYWAHHLGLSRPHLYALVDGTRQPSLTRALQIAKRTGGAVPVMAWPNLAAVVEAAGMATSETGGGE